MGPRKGQTGWVSLPVAWLNVEKICVPKHVLGRVRDAWSGKAAGQQMVVGGWGALP